MIKTIIFDFGGVLIDEPSGKMLAYCAEKLQVTKTKFIETASLYEVDWQKGKFPEDTYWENMTTQLCVSKPTTPSLWLEGFLHAYKEKTNVFCMTKQLQQQGYKIGFLSNTEIPVMQFVKQQQWSQFNFYIYSCEVGFRKPDKAIYELAIQTSQCKPGEIVFIDDREENIEGAEKLGIHGIHFRHSNELVKNLESLTVTV